MNYLIESKNLGEALKKLPLLQSGHARFLFEGEKTVGIDQIRQLKREISLRQVSAQTLVVKQALRLTTPAQSAFLKLLEEPPAIISFILITNNRQDLLPTIVSRCCLVSIHNQLPTFKDKDSLTRSAQFLQSLENLTQSCAYKNDIKKELKDNATALTYLTHWLAILRETLLLKVGVGEGQIDPVFANASIADLKKTVKIGHEYYSWMQTTNIGPDRLAGVFLNEVASICTKKKI